MYSQQLSLWVMAFVMLNTYGWAMIYLDKQKAQLRSAFRLPESSLFLVALFGGGIGTYLAMRVFRHKTQQLRFKLILPVLMVTSTAFLITGWYFLK